MKNLTLAVLFLVGLSACGSRSVKVLDASWVSMKHSMPPAPSNKITRISKVDDEYCVDSWSGDFGLMDEVVKKVEHKYEIDYIKYPAFTQSVGKPCMRVSGEGYRVTR